MRTKYFFGERLNEGVVRLRSDEYGQQLWTRGKVRAKWKECQVCAKMIAPGELAYSPLTNGFNRMHRIHASCVETPEAAAIKPSV